MRAFLLAGLLLFAGVAQAATQAQRVLFLDTLSDARAGGLDNRLNARALLEDYPLRNYLTIADLRYRLRRQATPTLDARIERFLAAHPDLPPAHSLRGAWLASLARRGRWSLVDRTVNVNDSTVNQCRAVHAAIELGGTPRAKARELWRVGRSQPDACDPVFAWLRAQGLLTPVEILRRARLALLEGQFGLVRYLGRKLPDDLAARTERWLDVAEAPSRLAHSRDLGGEIAAYAFKRLALRDLDAAADLYPRLVARLEIDADQRYEMQRYLALLYAQNHQPQALAWFARLDHTRMGEHAHGWEIRSAIYQRRWPLVIEAIDDLPAELAGDEEWRYWYARALAATGHADRAHAIYEPLSRTRSYHGYLAADALGRDYSLNQQPLAPDSGAESRVRARAALARAHELRALDMNHKAGREWNAAIDGLDPAALGQAARIAYEWGWYARAIITLARADYWDDLDIRYPTPHRETVRRSARDHALDPAYVFAVIRTESLFQPAIRSSAGAIGLMQLMPGTARRVASKTGDSTPSASTLTQPDVNIRLGTRYLHDMLERWDGNLALATASYNAGPSRIRRWLPEASMDPSIWIANIPYTETRRYVQRVMAHMTVFQSRLSETIVPLDTRIDAVRSAYGDTES